MVSTSRRLFLLLVAGVGGVVAGHGVDYVLVFPGGAHRAEELRATGHGYWGAAVVVGLVGGVAALVAAAVRGGRRGRGLGEGSRRGMSGGRQLALLSAFQVVLFAAVEFGERAAAGAPLAGLAHRPEFLVGLVLQVLTVAAVLRVLGGVESVAEAVTAWLVRRRRTVPRRLVVLVPRAEWVPLICCAHSSVSSRGPPRFAL